MRDKKDNVQVMIGSGEHSTFVNVKKGQKVMIGEGEHSVFIEAGITPEESRKRLDEKIDKIIEDFEKQQKKKQFKKNN